jgi:hypothetical protein
MGKIAFEEGPDRVLEAVKKAFPVVGISLVEEKIVSERPRAVEVRGKRRWSVRSWGETVEIKLTEDGRGGSFVEAKSECVDRDELIDFGRNRKNVEGLFGELAKQMKVVGPVCVEEKRR